MRPPRYLDGALLFVLVGLSMVLLAPRAVPAGPTDAVTLSLPSDEQGDPFVPGIRTVEELAFDYVEEEYLVEGAATLFTYASDPPLGPTDLAVAQEDVPYKTRILVRRPRHAHRFNGTVVIEWWNSTAGFDSAPSWDLSAEYFARRGIAYVGITNSTTSLEFLAGGCRVFGIFPPTCGARYETLSLPENGLAYEMVSQIAHLLKSRDPQNPLPSSFRVKRLFHVGESQQAGSVITYASAFHLDGINDGYFIQSNIHARPINFGPSCAAAGAPEFPNCTPRLVYPDSLVRTDLLVPVYQVITQTDFEVLGFNVLGRQPDTRTYRYYEVAGGAHNTVHRDIEVIPAGLFGPEPILLEDLCANELNTAADGPVFVSHVIDALWERMREQASRGWSPPSGIVMNDVEGVLERDEHGNVTGGVRLPSLDASLATYASSNMADPELPPLLQEIGDLVCRLSGSVHPFDEETLDALYPRRRSYFVEVLRSTIRLERQGLLLPANALETLLEALRR